MRNVDACTVIIFLEIQYWYGLPPEKFVRAYRSLVSDICNFCAQTKAQNSLKQFCDFVVLANQIREV